VLLLLDPVMELAMVHLNDFEGLELTSVESSKEAEEPDRPWTCCGSKP
jgi:hypothetical protein